MQIRRFDYQRDVSAVLTLMPELYESNFADFTVDAEFISRKRFQLREALRDPAQAVLVAEDERGLLGFIWVTIDQEYSGARRGEVAAVCVAPGRRAAGVGRALMQQGEAALRLMGASMIHLMVTATNAPAVSLYQSLGYDITRYQMEKPLRRPEERGQGRPRK